MRTMLAMAMVTIAAVSYADVTPQQINTAMSAANGKKQQADFAKAGALTARNVCVFRGANPKAGDDLIALGNLDYDEGFGFYQVAVARLLTGDLVNALTWANQANTSFTAAYTEYASADLAYNAAK